MSVTQKKKRPDPASYRIRSYRDLDGHGALAAFTVSLRETDLAILASTDLAGPARDAVLLYRSQIESQIAAQPLFRSTLLPLPFDPLAPPLIKSMLAAGLAAGVGPMAAVAGAIAEYVGRDLLAAGAEEVVVENGGDIFLARSRESLVGVFAGSSPLSGRFAIRIPQSLMPLGICTSSGTVGHSLSLGEADSVTVLAADTALADAAATRLGNAVSVRAGIKPALDLALQIKGLLGVVIICGEEIGAWGAVELVPL